MVSVPGPSCRPSVQGVNPPVCCVLDAAVIYARDSSCYFLGGPFVLSRGGGADMLAPGLHQDITFQTLLFSEGKIKLLNLLV